MIPGRTLHRLAAQLCSEKTLERVVKPAIADLQKEYAGAGVGGASRRVWVLLAGYAAILKVIALCAVRVPTTGDERRAVARTLAWSVTMVLVIVVLLMLPPLYRFPVAMKGWRAAATLLPQAVVLAIPLGVAFGIAFGLRARPTMSIAKMMLLCALAASALNFANLAWAMPAGNQAFNDMTFRALTARGYQGPTTGLPKAYNEMTLSEMRSESARFLSEGEPRRARQLTFRFHLRFALAVAAFALASVLLAAPVGHRGFRVFLALAACFIYWTLMLVGELGSGRGYLPQLVGAWLPNLALIASAMLVAAWRGPANRLRQGYGGQEAGHYRY